MNYQIYQKSLNTIGVKLTAGKNYLNCYNSYMKFENEWDYYLNNIFLKHLNTQNDILRVVLFESAPNGLYPNANYIFSNLKNTIHGITDRYLYQTYKAFIQQVPNPSPTKLECLSFLARQNVLIIDLFPFHGFQLNPKIRKEINSNLASLCDYKKINSTIIHIRHLCSNIQIHTAYGTPPKINYASINKNINGAKSFGSFTSGSGFPSFNLLDHIIKKGF